MQNIDIDEVKNFDNMAQYWWDLNGPCEPLHVINPTRMSYIIANCELTNKRVLDVGCGGGILTESLAKSGAITYAIDASLEAIEIARKHATSQDLNIEYYNNLAEDFAKDNTGKFDVITCMELLEHVPNPESLINACAKMLKPNGKLFFSTINRNPKAYLTAIIGAEYLLKLIPKNTHKYAKFIKPAELAKALRENNFNVQNLSGMGYNPITKKSYLSKNMDVNYLGWASYEL